MAAERHAVEVHADWLGLPAPTRMGTLYATARVRDVAKFFRIDRKRADSIIAEVVQAVRGWRIEAKQAGISGAEQERMSSAFAVAETHRL